MGEKWDSQLSESEDGTREDPYVAFGLADNLVDDRIASHTQNVLPFLVACAKM